ncbi:unnamed protein product [Merluccius merluccius]
MDTDGSPPRTDLNPSLCKTAGDLTAVKQDLGDWIAECGVPGIFSATVEDVPKIFAYVVKHYIFLRGVTEEGILHDMLFQAIRGSLGFGKV